MYLFSSGNRPVPLKFSPPQSKRWKDSETRAIERNHAPERSWQPPELAKVTGESVVAMGQSDGYDGGKYD